MMATASVATAEAVPRATGVGGGEGSAAGSPQAGPHQYEGVSWYEIVPEYVPAAWVAANRAPFVSVSVFVATGPVDS